MDSDNHSSITDIVAKYVADYYHNISRIYGYEMYRDYLDKKSARYWDNMSEQTNLPILISELYSATGKIFYDSIDAGEHGIEHTVFDRRDGSILCKGTNSEVKCALLTLLNYLQTE